MKAKLNRQAMQEAAMFLVLMLQLCLAKQQQFLKEPTDLTVTAGQQVTTAVSLYGLVLESCVRSSCRVQCSTKRVCCSGPKTGLDWE